MFINFFLLLIGKNIKKSTRFPKVIASFEWELIFCSCAMLHPCEEFFFSVHIENFLNHIGLNARSRSNWSTSRCRQDGKEATFCVILQYTLDFLSLSRIKNWASTGTKKRQTISALALSEHLQAQLTRVLQLYLMWSVCV